MNASSRTDRLGFAAGSLAGAALSLLVAAETLARLRLPFPQGAMRLGYCLLAGVSIAIAGGCVVALLRAERWSLWARERSKRAVLCAVLCALAAALAGAGAAAQPMAALLLFVESGFWLATAALLWIDRRWLLRFSALVLAGIVPGLAVLGIVNHWQRWAASLPDYGDMGIEMGKTLVNQGGLLKPNVRTRARGTTLLETIRWRTESHGFRNDREIPPTKPAGVYRVLVLGDSFSGGYRLDQDKTFPAVLEERLRQVGIEAQVLNAVTEDPLISAEYLRRHGDDFEPDAVVLAFCVGNDFLEVWYRTTFSRSFDWLPERLRDRDTAKISTEREEGYDPDFIAITFPDEYLSRRRPIRVASPAPGGRDLHWLAVAARALRPASLRQNARGDLAPDATLCAFLAADGLPHPMDLATGFGFYAKGSIPCVDRAYEDTAAVLEWINDFCRSRGLRFLLAPIPQPFEIDPAIWTACVESYGLRSDRFDLGRPNHWFRDVCAAKGIEWADLLDVLKQARARGVKRLFIGGGDMHWAAPGARVCAERVAEILAGPAPENADPATDGGALPEERTSAAAPDRPNAQERR